MCFTEPIVVCFVTKYFTTGENGTGIRERMGLLGVAIDEQKEVIRIIVSEDQANAVFQSMYLARDLDKPGRGIMYMTKLDWVATYIPDDVLEKLA